MVRINITPYYHIDVAEQWDELTPRQACEMCGILAMPRQPQQTRFALFFSLLQFPRRWLLQIMFAIRRSTAAEFMHNHLFLTDFLLKMQAESMKMQTIKAGGRTYHAPGKIGALSFYQFIKCEACFRAANNSMRDLAAATPYLQKLAASLYLPKGEKYTDEQYRQQLPGFEQLPFGLLAAVFVWYRHAREKMLNAFPELTGKAKGRSLTGDHWLDVLYHLGGGLETPAAKNYQQTNIHIILVELRARKRQADQLEQEQKRQQKRRKK